MKSTETAEIAGIFIEIVTENNHAVKAFIGRKKGRKEVNIQDLKDLSVWLNVNVAGGLVRKDTSVKAGVIKQTIAQHKVALEDRVSSTDGHSRTPMPATEFNGVTHEGVEVVTGNGFF